MTDTLQILDTEEASQAEASQWRLMWNNFRQHRLAMFGGFVILSLYFIALFAEFIAPFDPHASTSKNVYHPPQFVKLIDHKDDGSWAFRPHVQLMKLSRDPITLEGKYTQLEGQKVYLTLFGKGDPYKLWGKINMRRHLLVPQNPSERFYLLGADRLGRDMLSRTIIGTRISMSIGLVGVALSLFIGIILGGISGYYGGTLDTVIQRIIEIMIALPTIPLWLALSAAMPQDWSTTTRYFAITVILSLVGWTELARVVRGRFLTLRSEDFVIAAKLDGGSQWRIIFRHILPSITSHIIAAVTLAIPAMILAETALSFLGLGLQPPAVSWGVLLLEVQNIRSIAAGPWLFLPGLMVLIAVLSLNFLGDGLRDAADPYARKDH
ncbi:ABC transporter permease [Arcticibacterium luteifluviistationis]|uniref:Peptide ABC transporter permease n=1 Tax=Arcticibacterium luteifluviistationis TaxID=1784714 RepID=A0A2Z4G7I8_9BACT|nr:ABC transporter permease [Arcticibacterium luteifluviistationis]AWV97119.1 peptide ABC transporter permease [Arcticibacterium luteifluviistationis]